MWARLALGVVRTVALSTLLRVPAGLRAFSEMQGEALLLAPGATPAPLLEPSDRLNANVAPHPSAAPPGAAPAAS